MRQSKKDEFSLPEPRGTSAAVLCRVSDKTTGSSVVWRAMQGVRFAYYLVHSLQAWGDYAEKEKTSALNFAEAAKAVGVERIIYLGGLGLSGDDLSVHLRSRQLAGAALRQTGVAVTEFRAGVIIGSGSASFGRCPGFLEGRGL